MKTPSNELMELINCMSLSERQLFISMHNKGDSVPDYLKLFKALESKKGNVKEATVTKKLKLNNLKRIKHYLYNSLLEFLSTQQASNFEKEVIDLIGVGNLLMDRSMFVQASNVFMRAKKKAVRYELHHYHMIIEEKLFHAAGHQNNMQFVVSILSEQKEKEFDRIIHDIRTEEEYKRAILMRWQFYEKHGAIFRNKEQTIQFLNMLRPYVIGRNEDALTTKAKHDYYSLAATYFREKNYIDKAVDFLERSAKLAEENKLEMVGMLPQLLVSLNNLLFIYAKYDMMEKLRATLDKIHSNLPSKASNRKVGLVSLMVYESHYCKYVPDYPLRSKKLRWIEREYPTILDKNRTLRTIQTVCNLSVAHFCDSNFKRALELINTLDSRPDFLNFKSMVSLIKVYKLILYFEMGKHDLLAFSTRNTYRYLLKNQMYEQFEKSVIKGLNKLIVANTAKSQREALLLTYNDLLRVKANPFEKSVFQVFNFCGWIKCRLDREDFKYLMTVA